MYDDSEHETNPQKEVERKGDWPSFLPSRGTVWTGSREYQKRNPDVEGVPKGHHGALSIWSAIIRNFFSFLVFLFLFLFFFLLAVLFESLTNMSARSSESSLTIVLTVEYKIGLKQPANPNRYQATNLTNH